MSDQQDSSSPGQAWILYQSMIDLHSKLLTINYSRDYRTKFKTPAIHSLQLAVQQDWFVFASLYAFLTDKDIDVHVTGKREILETIKDDLINKNPDEMLLTKIKEDKLDGQSLIKILHLSIEEKLGKLELTKQIIIKGSENEDVVDEEEDAEEMEEIDYIVIDENDEKIVEEDGYLEEKQAVIKANCDEKDWKMEVERILPQLRLTYDRNEKNNWRSHLNELHQWRKSLQMDSTWTLLNRWKEDINSASEKIANREKYLWTQLENVCLEWANVRTKLDRIKEEFGKSSVGVTTKSAQLQTLSESLDLVRSELESAGSSLNDQSSLTEIRRSLNAINSELTSMNLEIGVAMVTLLVSKVY